MRDVEVWALTIIVVGYILVNGLVQGYNDSRLDALECAVVEDCE